MYILVLAFFRVIYSWGRPHLHSFLCPTPICYPLSKFTPAETVPKALPQIVTRIKRIVFDRVLGFQYVLSRDHFNQFLFVWKIKAFGNYFIRHNHKVNTRKNNKSVVIPKGQKWGGKLSYSRVQIFLITYQIACKLKNQF